MKPYTCPECLKPCRGKWENAGLGYYECWGVESYDNVPSFVSECCSEPIPDEEECDEDTRY